MTLTVQARDDHDLNTRWWQNWRVVSRAELTINRAGWERRVWWSRGSDPYNSPVKWLALAFTGDREKASQVTHWVKNLPAMQLQSLSQKDGNPFWPGESPRTEEPDGLQSTGSQRVGHDWACMHETENFLKTRSCVEKNTHIQFWTYKSELFMGHQSK